MKRILLAVDDSPGGVRAARAAVRLAAAVGGCLRAITIQVDEAAPEGTVDGAVLAFVRDAAEREKVPVETALLEGQPARVVLEQAGTWGADVVVVGRSGRRHVGEHYIGADVKHVLEFTEVPVLVVPGD